MNPISIVLGFGLIAGCSAVYTFGTRFNKQIIIKKKYITQSDGFSNYMVTDHIDNIFRVSKSFWLWKFDNAETWNLLEKNQSYYIEGFGRRIPFLHMYPHIIRVKELSNENFQKNGFRHSFNHKPDLNLNRPIILNGK